jgi:hypothetical protein
MKKGLIGCLVVGLLLLVIGGGLAFWFLKPYASSAVSGIESIQQLAKAGQASTDIKNTSDFTPPADGTMTAAQMAMYLAVQDAVQTRVATQFDALKAEGDALEARAKAEGRDANPTEGMALMGKLTALVAQGKQAQVEALNRNNTSLSEYEWVRGQVYQALPLASSDEIPEAMAGQVNAANVALVRPHREALAKGVGLSMLGM